MLAILIKNYWQFLRKEPEVGWIRGQSFRPLIQRTFGSFRIEQSRVRYGDSIPPSSISRQLFQVFYNTIPEKFSGLGRTSPLPPDVMPDIWLFQSQALLLWWPHLTCVSQDMVPPQQGHAVISFLYSILIACALSSFLNRLRNSRHPMKFLHTGINLRLFWLLRIP